MMSDMTCQAFADTLADFLERDVAEPTRAAMESHALACGECGPLLADLRKLRVDAANLPELVPSRDLWAGIAARIDAPVIPIRTREAGAERRWGRSARWASMAAAAALLVVLTSATTYYLTVRGADRRALAVAPSPTSVTRLPQGAAPVIAIVPPAPAVIPSQVARVAEPSLESTLGARGAVPISRASNAKPTAEQVYGSEIARLRAIVERRRTQIDPVTVSVIERNLKVIDDAIAQCKGALAKDPASRFLIESLNKALENKVELLRTAAMLPSRA